MYTLRPAAASDRDFLYRLLKAAMGEYYTLTYGGWIDEAERIFFDRSYADLEYRIIVCGGQDVGCLTLTKTQNELFIHELHLLPEHQNRGIGGAVMHSIIAASEKAGIPVRLDVLKSNPRARVFYERLGFKKSGENQSHFHLTRDPRPDQ